MWYFAQTGASCAWVPTRYWERCSTPLAARYFRTAFGVSPTGSTETATTCTFPASVPSLSIVVRSAALIRGQTSGQSTYRND